MLVGLLALFGPALAAAVTHCFASSWPNRRERQRADASSGIFIQRVQTKHGLVQLDYGFYVDRFALFKARRDIGPDEELFITSAGATRTILSMVRGSILAVSEISREEQRGVERAQRGVGVRQRGKSEWAQRGGAR